MSEASALFIRAEKDSRGKMGGMFGVDKKGAAQKYEEAANKYGRADNLEKMFESYMKAAEIRVQLKENREAANLYKATAATAMKLDKKDDARVYYEKAGQMYAKDEDIGNATSLFKFAAKSFHRTDPDIASHFYLLAAQLRVKEDQFATATNLLSDAIAYALKADQLELAIKLNEKQMQYSNEIDNKDLFYLSISSAIVLSLITSDTTSASLVMKNNHEDSEFIDSLYGDFSRLLVDSFEERDAELLKKAQKHQNCGRFHNEIQKAVAKLSVPGGGGGGGVTSGSQDAEKETAVDSDDPDGIL